MQMRQRDAAALDAKYTKELADAKAEHCPQDDVAAGRRRLHIVLGLQQRVTHASWRIMRLPGLADTAERDYFTLREADHYAKINEGTQKRWLTSSADRVAHIDGQLMQLLHGTMRFQRV